MGLETIRLYEIIIRDLFSLITTMQHNNSGSKQLSASKTGSGDGLPSREISNCYAS
jgi:hypothetical protein